jgi:alpha-beta hydrolase superfamily lysophospholipase
MALRLAVEFPLAPERVVRGFRITPEGSSGTVLFLHDLGMDLDEFGTLPDLLAEQGWDVVCVDLIGHGLSDGDDAEPALLHTDVRAIVGQLTEPGRPLGLVASGTTSTVSSLIGRADGVVAHVVMNPVLDDSICSQVQRAQATRMVLHGDGEKLVGTSTQRFFQFQLGEKMLVHNPVMAKGVAGVLEERALRAHFELFFKRYLK